MSSQAPAKLKSPRLELRGTPVVSGPVEPGQMSDACRDVEAALKADAETEDRSE